MGFAREDWRWQEEFNRWISSSRSIDHYGEWTSSSSGLSIVRRRCHWRVSFVFSIYQHVLYLACFQKPFAGRRNFIWSRAGQVSCEHFRRQLCCKTRLHSPSFVWLESRKIDLGFCQRSSYCVLTNSRLERASWNTRRSVNGTNS